MPRFKTLASLTALLAATVLPQSAMAQDEESGGVISVAIIGEPPTLDPVLSTTDVVSIVTQHFFETLYTFDSEWNVRPLLATDMPEISDDGKTYVIGIREGITFHDGSTMDAHDVVDSLVRWTELATRGKGVAEKIDSIEAVDDFTVQISLNTPYSPLLSLLAFSNSAAIVVPQEVIGDELSAIVGTGPYELIEHAPDQYIQVGRFDEYVSRTEPADAAFGQRHQYLDEIRFIPVPDSNTRIEGAVAGQFDYADGLPNESYSRLEESENVEPVLLEPFGWPVFAFNLKQGLMTDPLVRQAVQAALNPDDMLLAAFGEDRFFKVAGAMFPEGHVWHNTAGVELYNQADPARAAELLEQAGYDDTPLRILTSHQYDFHFKMAEVAKVYLEQAGFTVDMQVTDWATLSERRNNPELWDIYITHSPFLPEPALTSMYDSTSRVGWDDPEKEEVWTQLNSVTDLEQRQALFAELQGLLYEQAAFYKVGNFNAVSARNPALTGVPETPWPFFWNAQIEEPAQ
ncbi:ABC transporter substrate-binding protein [Inquilinus sp. CAU 1745]|uniref:ABC transporter substrate-binding protein n=1 Tax=Inquilinus sp. CAU 1745 TaxID=3140369 RepID=UPI00325B621D